MEVYPEVCLKFATQIWENSLPINLMLIETYSASGLRQAEVGSS